MVIGAGAAGLAAARTLIANGLSTVVVEGADRIGGRAFTESATFGVPYDHGCSWAMGPADLPFFAMAREWGFTLLDHSSAGEAFYVGDRRASGAESRAYDTAWGAITGALNAAGRAGKDISAASAVPEGLTYAGLAQTWMGPMDFAVDFADLSTMDWWEYGEVEAYYMIREGYGALVARAGADLPVQLATPATGVDWSGDGVTVETPAGAIRAKACIVTVSTGVLQAGAIRFAPALPGWKLDAIDDVPMGLLAKIALQFEGERFGLRANDWLTYATPEEVPAEACFFLTFPFDFDIMVGFVGGDFGWRLSDEGPDAAIDFALGEVVKMFGSDARKRFVKGHLTGWARDRWTLGAYAAARPGRYAARAELARPVAERVFFAGEAVAMPWVQLCGGAWLNGEAVARDVAATLA